MCGFVVLLVVGLVLGLVFRLVVGLVVHSCSFVLSSCLLVFCSFDSQCFN